jgi:hypothetical protein
LHLGGAFVIAAGPVVRGLGKRRPLARAGHVRGRGKSVIGAKTQPLWVEIAEFLRSSLPHIE